MSKGACLQVTKLGAGFSFALNHKTTWLPMGYVSGKKQPTREPGNIEVLWAATGQAISTLKQGVATQ